MLSTVAGCAGQREHTARQQLDQHPQANEWLDAPAPSASTTSLAAAPAQAARSGQPSESSSASERLRERTGASGSLGSYLARAYEQSPRLRASFHRWRAQVQSVASERRLPNPRVSFGYFVRSVETRVGPQRARLGIQQEFPWPGGLSSRAEAASERALAAERQFEAQALLIQNRVAVAYWRLWEVRRLRDLHRKHLTVLQNLSDTTRARLTVGQVELADQQQVDLAVARLEDSLRSMDESEAAAEAQLRGAVGLEPGAPVPTTEEPPVAALPVSSPEELTAAVRSHPGLDALELQALSQEATARARAAERLPSFSVGADWIITGDAPDPSAPESGKDAVVVGGGISVPLWQGNYKSHAAAAESEAMALRWERQAAADAALAELGQTLSEVRDAVRRIDFYQTALLPQAESTYSSVLGSYTAGRGTVAQALLAQEELLELHLDLERVRAEYARAWARLEAVTGRRLTPQEVP